MEQEQTKYYFVSYDKDWEEIPLNRENWFFAQMDGSIRTAFMKYNMPLPKYAIIDRVYKVNGVMNIVLVRGDLNNEKKCFNWYKNWLLVQDELNIQANANSNDEITYKFRII